MKLRRRNVLVREEQERDRAQVRTVNLAAFDSPLEAALVDRLREEAHPFVSMVALDGETVIGHILFSPVVLSGHEDLRILGLGPMAIAPAHQRMGVGSVLVRAGLERCRELGYGAVVVLGHPEYYPRFGFVPAARSGIRCEYEVPEEAFMLVELQQGYLVNAPGTISYHAAFDAV
jgi:putative acetyltransferase